MTERERLTNEEMRLLADCSPSGMHSQDEVQAIIQVQNKLVRMISQERPSEGEEKPASDLATFAEARAQWEKEHPHGSSSTTEGEAGDVGAHNYIVFRCDADDSTIVSVEAPERGKDVYLGVAECPDMRTAQVVMESLRARQSGPGKCELSTEPEQPAGEGECDDSNCNPFSSNTDDYCWKCRQAVLAAHCPNCKYAFEPSTAEGERLQEMAFADGFTVGWVVGKRADLATPMTQRVLEAATQAWVDGEMSRGIPESEEEETK